jgi:hypothetical protein
VRNQIHRAIDALRREQVSLHSPLVVERHVFVVLVSIRHVRVSDAAQRGKDSVASDFARAAR